MRAKRVFLFLAILSGMITACFGLETQHSNHLGWALLLSGTGIIVVSCISLGALFLHNAGEQPSQGPSLWLPILGALIISLVTPLEYLFLPPVLPRSDHAQDIGLILCAGGLAFYLLSLHSAHPWALPGWPAPARASLASSPILRTVLCPISASLLLFVVGLGIGYSSLIGLFIAFLLVLPGLIHRVKFGDSPIAK